MREKIDTLIEQNENGFSRQIEISKTQLSIHAAIEAHTKFPQLSLLVRTLEDAARQGVVTSRVLLPENPKGMAMFIEWHHEHPNGKNGAGFVAANRQLFLLASMFRKAGCADDFFIEGPPYEFASSQSPEILVPGTATAVYSAEGQELLLQDPKRIDTLIGPGGALGGNGFHHCLWHEQFKDAHGIERPASHDLSKIEMPQLAGLEVITQNDLLLINGFLAKKTGTRSGNPKVCIFGNYQIPLPELIEKCERYCTAIELFAQMQIRRNGEIIQRMQETMPKGIAKIFCGKFHSIDLRKLCSDKNIGLVIATPTSCPPLDDSYFDLLADQRNSNYHIIKFLIPQFKNILNQAN